MTLKKTNKTMFSTSFRDDEMSAVQENDLNHLLDMFAAIKQQVLLRRALSENKKMRWKNECNHKRHGDAKKL